MRQNSGSKRRRMDKQLDRISDLPDSLIHHIFSFMETIHVIRTCILSRRWRYLWTSLSHLHFHSNHSRGNRHHFENFISHFLSHRDQSNVFSFSFVNSDSDSDSDSTDRGFRFPSRILNCQSLTALKVKASRDFEDFPTANLNLPKLKTLHLERVWFCYNESKCLEPFSNCLNLTELTLIDCRALNFGALNIVSPQLANLMISCSLYGTYKVVISAPKLSSFSFSGELPPLLFLSEEAGSLPCLEKVKIETTSLDDPVYIRDFKKMVALRVINMFRVVRDAKFLTLSSATIEVLSMFPDILEHQPSPFRNLESLKMNVLQRSTTSVIPDHVKSYLLNYSPSVIIIEEFPFSSPCQWFESETRKGALWAEKRKQRKMLSSRMAYSGKRKQKNKAIHQP